LLQFLYDLSGKKAFESLIFELPLYRQIRKCPDLAADADRRIGLAGWVMVLLGARF
jgi:hypothetical protein